jgi:cobalt-zinc-cadmium efflux system membrane fusion protein
MALNAFLRRMIGSGPDAARRRVGLLMVCGAVIGMMSWHLIVRAQDTDSSAASAHVGPRDADAVDLSDSQREMIRIDTASEHTFPRDLDAVGSIDFNEDMAAQVSTPYQGRIVEIRAKIGDAVAKGQVLFTIESPDLIQAESNLIAAAGVLELTSRALERAKQLYGVQGIAEKDLQQASSDQQTAEGALKAARDAVAVFGKRAEQIDHIVQTRTVDPDLVITSPISGRITARNAAPGDFVQPGNTPAPFGVADLSHVWLNASVAESDMPQVHNGQKVHVSVMALPDRQFVGEISTVGATVDPQLHRGLVRAEIEDPKHELLPGMLAAFAIEVADPVSAAALPAEGVVREGDGSTTVWVTTDRHHFKRRIVKVGLTHDGYDQVLEGLQAGEQVVTKGALFLDNMTGDGAPS